MLSTSYKIFTEASPSAERQGAEPDYLTPHRSEVKYTQVRGQDRMELPATPIHTLIVSCLITHRDLAFTKPNVSRIQQWRDNTLVPLKGLQASNGEYHNLNAKRSRVMKYNNYAKTMTNSNQNVVCTSHKTRASVTKHTARTCRKTLLLLLLLYRQYYYCE